jgi:hypothetical protein
MSKIKPIPESILKLGVNLHGFESIEQYTDIQTGANKRKIERQMVRYPQIRFMAAYIKSDLWRSRFWDLPWYTSWWRTSGFF